MLTNTLCLVPLLAGTQVQAKAYASTVELWHDGRCVARHASAVTAVSSRSWTWNIISTFSIASQWALAGSKPLEQRRQAGIVAAEFNDRSGSGKR